MTQRTAYCVKDCEICRPVNFVLNQLLTLKLRSLTRRGTMCFCRSGTHLIRAVLHQGGSCHEHPMTHLIRCPWLNQWWSELRFGLMCDPGLLFKSDRPKAGCTNSKALVHYSHPFSLVDLVCLEDIPWGC